MYLRQFTRDWFLHVGSTCRISQHGSAETMKSTVKRPGRLRLWKCSRKTKRASVLSFKPSGDSTLTTLTRRRWSMVHSRSSSSSSNAWQMMRSRLWTIAGKDGQLCAMWHESFRMEHHFYHDTVWMKRPVGPHWYRIQVWENWTKNVINTLAKWRASTWNFPYFTAILKV